MFGFLIVDRSWTAVSGYAAFSAVRLSLTGRAPVLSLFLRLRRSVVDRRDLDRSIPFFAEVRLSEMNMNHIVLEAKPAAQPQRTWGERCGTAEAFPH